MANDGRNRFDELQRATESLQETAERAGPAAGASYTLIGAIILLGGIGYGIDRWRGTSPWFLLGGLLLGIVVGMYELAKTVFSPAAPASATKPKDDRPADGE
jgi:F0F1-type ATP synthase assembly protein I